MSAPWMQTRGGQKWEILSPDRAKVDFDEVGYALSLLCRFNGHATRFYSVAEHSVRVWQTVAAETACPRTQLVALLHDAHEFVLGDQTTPMAHALAALTKSYNDEVGLPDAIDYSTVLKDLKARTDRAIFKAAGLTWEDVQEAEATVKRADVAVLMREREVILTPHPEPWDAALEAVPPAKVDIVGLHPRAAADLFGDILSRKLMEVREDNKSRGIDPLTRWP